MMYVHWRERELEELDVLVKEDPVAIVALKQCRLWKFFHCPFMKARPRLLNALMEYLHPDVGAFMLEVQSLNVNNIVTCTVDLRYRQSE
jgi:hypothetical protein